MDQPELNHAVRDGLAQYWSPEQIAGRLHLESTLGERPVSARTIYRWIRRDKHQKR